MRQKGVGILLARPSSQDPVLTIDGPRTIYGRISVTGDKSITHRAMLLAFLAGNSCRLENISSAADCRRTLAALVQMGLECLYRRNTLVIHGRPSGWEQGRYQVWAGNSGTTARLFMGLAAFLATGGSLTIDGDTSLRARPMARVARYLEPMGLRITWLAKPGCLPVTLARPGAVRAGRFVIEEPSAQVKSALLLASLAARGETELVQSAVTRDHTERLMTAMGIPLRIGKDRVTVAGGLALPTFPPYLAIPGDFSSAACWLALAAVAGEVRVEGVGVNPTRTGLLEVLKAMGAGIKITNRRQNMGEPVADVTVTNGELRGVFVAPEIIPRCIDELPLLAVVAACARGKTEVRGAGELKYKESDRLAAIGQLLEAFSVRHQLLEDGFVIWGGRRLTGAAFASSDHRMVMAAAIAACLAQGQSRVGSGHWLAVSYPDFARDLMQITKFC